VKQILTKDPEGIVIFIEDKHPHVTGLLQARLHYHMPDFKDRILFLPRMPEADYLQLLKLAHVALDTLYYGGGANTCYDCFAVGTPLVTLPTFFHRGRYAFAAYQQMSIAECIASTQNDYVEKAIRLATDDTFRRQVQQKILAAQHQIFEDQQVIEELATFFHQAIQPD